MNAKQPYRLNQILSDIPGQEQINKEHGFAMLFKEYYPKLVLFTERIVGSEEASDIVEDIFCKIWSKQPKFESEEHLKAHLYRSAKNACLDYIKTSTRANERQMVFAGTLGDTEESFLNEVVRAEVISSLYLAIEGLPAQCSKIIRLTYIDGLSNQEAADEMGIALKTVKNQKLRGLSLLRGRMPKESYLLLLMYLQEQITR